MIVEKTLNNTRAIEINQQQLTGTLKTKTEGGTTTKLKDQTTDESQRTIRNNQRQNDLYLCYNIQLLSNKYLKKWQGKNEKGQERENSQAETNVEEKE